MTSPIGYPQGDSLKASSAASLTPMPVGGTGVNLPAADGLTQAQATAGAVGVAGVTADGTLLGPNGSPVSGGGGTTAGAETITASVPVSVTTTVTPAGGDFVAFASTACTELRVVNRSGVTLEYRRGGAGATMPLLPGRSRRIAGLTNASEISVRRADFATAPVNGTVNTVSTLTGFAVTSSAVLTGVSIVNQTIGSGLMTALPSTACASAEMVNCTGKALVYTVGEAANPAIRLDHGESAVISAITNLSRVFVRPVDQVAAGMLRPLAIEVSTDGLPGPLQLEAPARAVDLRATVALPDLMYPALFPTPPVLTLPQMIRQRRALRKKGAIPLARFMTVGSSTLSKPAACADVASGDTIWGPTALEYTNAGSFDIANFAADVLATGINVANGSIHLTYSMPAGVVWTTSSLHYVDIDLFSAGTPAAPGSNYHTCRINGSQQLQALISVSNLGLIKGYSVPIGNFTAAGTGADLAAVKWARVVIKANGSAAIGAKFRPMMVEWVPNAASKGVVVFTFDGPQDGTITNVLPLMSRYGYPGSIFLASTANMGITGRQTPRMLQMLNRVHGWQIVNHTYKDETSRPMSDEEMLQEQANYIAAMAALGVVDTEDCAYGSQTITNIGDYNMQAVQRNYRSATLFLSPATTTTPFAIGETLPFGDPYRVRRVAMSGYTAGTVAAMWQAHIDQAIANKGVAIFGAHAEFNAAGEALTALGTVLEYCRTKALAGELEVLTLAGAISRGY